MRNPAFDKLNHGLQRGDEVFVDGDWYPIIGYAGDSLFTSKPRGKHEAWLGYRINEAEVTDARRPERAA
jgi:hypothetical protein